MTRARIPDGGLAAPQVVERALLKLVESRHPKTVCPSEVARQLAPDDWRPLLDSVRDVAARLQRRGRIDITQRGKVVDPARSRGPLRLRLARAAEDYRRIDFRKHPELYRVGRGEQGVLTVEPYKSELLPLWRFKTQPEARASARALRRAFERYRDDGDFVGMDMARKFLQMGFTRARRYASHRSGRKYDERGNVAASAPDPEKARAAEVFQRAWQRVERDAQYRAAREAHAKRLKADSRAAQMHHSRIMPH